MLVVGVLSGGFIFIALNLITCVSAFWIVDSVPVTRLVFDNHLFAQYPLTIYPEGDQHPADVGHPLRVCLLLPGQLPAQPRDRQYCLVRSVRCGAAAVYRLSPLATGPEILFGTGT
jgi:hypothetical protein